MLLVLALLAHAVPGPAPAGPPLQPRVRLQAPRMHVDMDAEVKQAMKEMAGAVVVVEGRYESPIPKHLEAVTILKGRLRLSRSAPGMDTRMLPAWMNPGSVVGGGNVLHKSYPIGWGY